MHMCVECEDVVFISTQSCEEVEEDTGCVFFLSPHSPEWNGSLTEPETCRVGQVCSPASSKESMSLVLNSGVTGCTSMPGFSMGIANLNLSPRAYISSTFLTAIPSP